MKIGIFADVHGHLAKLHQTLTLLRSHQVDEIVCLGDLVDKGIHSDAVVQLMREQAIPCVQGNHDAKVRFTWLSDREPLQDSSLMYLTNLPPTLTFNWAGVTVYMAHANPWEDSSIYVFPTRPMALFEEVARDVDANIIVLGHTHHPMRIDVGDKIIINPGSIYGNRDRPERTCGILSLPACEFEIYDIDTGLRLAL